MQVQVCDEHVSRISVDGCMYKLLEIKCAFLVGISGKMAALHLEPVGIKL